ncbi:MAG TPA: DUF4365 domain-containing protein [Candidatus Nanopelagicales bacterium]|nr:DUF4365 domain-containing protein [Candidatus Nanopelagicales bacterium]
MRYTEQAQGGDRGIAFLQQVAAEAGFIFRPFPTADVGIDGAIELLDERREPTGDLILVQMKSGPSYTKGGRFVLRADRAHFQTWARYGVPVVGIIHDPVTRAARWVDISKHLREKPGVIEGGPYALTAPASQPFSAASFPSFVERFQRPRGDATRLDAAPNLLIRAWKRDDAEPTRALLQPIAADYPGFDGWLERQWAKEKDSEVSKKVLQVGRAIAAYSMWTRKDARNVKLQTFFVGHSFRDEAIGQHLLYHEIRTWTQKPEIERVTVTVASSKAYLVDFFRRFGFRVEGIAANRYQRASGAAELVLVKHLVRRVIRDADALRAFAGDLASLLWGLDPAGAPELRSGIAAGSLAFPVAFPPVHIDVDPRSTTASPRITLRSGEQILSRHDDADLMRDFYPLRVHLARKKYVIIPIFPEWVGGMLLTLGGGAGAPSSLKLRVDNVYYCYPKLSALDAGDLVLFYETKRNNGRGAIIGAAVIREARRDTPEALYGRFSDRGVYTLEDIRHHAHKRDGTALAIHFELFEPFSRLIPLDRVREALGNAATIQGLTPIPREPFEQLREEGLPLP